MHHPVALFFFFNNIFSLFLFISFISSRIHVNSSFQSLILPHFPSVPPSCSYATVTGHCFVWASGFESGAISSSSSYSFLAHATTHTLIGTHTCYRSTLDLKVLQGRFMLQACMILMWQLCPFPGGNTLSQKDTQTHAHWVCPHIRQHCFLLFLKKKERCTLVETASVCGGFI